MVSGIRNVVVQRLPCRANRRKIISIPFRHPRRSQQQDEQGGTQYPFQL